MIPVAETLRLLSAAALLVALWLGVAAFSLQIYFDFSAYSDMAIGLGQTLGFRYKENFRFPYASLSVSEFWRRWHISMGSSFRDYVYIPLGGNRRGTARTVLNMLLVWALTGLWHGAAWNFVLWGLYFGVLLIAERFVLHGLLERLPRLLRWLIAFTLVTLSWSIFYYTDLSSVAQALGALFGVGISGASDAAAVAVLRTYGIWALGAFVLSLPVVPAVAEKLPGKLRGVLEISLTVLLFAASLLFLIGQSYNPFIYFRF